MNNEAIWEKVVAICQDVFDDESIVLGRESSAATVEPWDSLTHLTILGEIEDEFEIKFTLEEFSSAKNLGELVDIVEKKVKG